MNYSSENTDLKRLLTSWHCEILYNLFRDEEISIEELKLIKNRHLRQLLKNYKMGVRIRFEHYFEIWRNRIGIPFQGEEDSKCSCNCKTERLANITYNGHAMLYETIPKEPMPIEGPQPAIKPPTFSQENINIQNQEILPKYELRSATQRRFADDTMQSDNDDGSTHGGDPLRHKIPCPYNLPQILQMSGDRGIAIVKYYEQHQGFTTSQRSELIRVICDFFEEHEYNLSLQISYKLEREIFQMFPSEKLQYYRTEKRGKIYVRFVNMKRMRKQRSERNIETHTTTPQRDVAGKLDETYEDENMTNFDAWSEDAGEKEDNVKPDINN
ncbi:uncharacterized protein LOC133331608 [Musca vetustissima]|uniref:uncharacterized protein LOC133331608 n=1 Tax=Musca vetustissima TaxID=27455 RepID=UPI002AB617B3|nr:uncharacterized protein LOC133331608 [Musca vetustissima]